MDWLLFLIWIIVIACFLLGLAGIILPALPGPALVFVGILIHAAYDDFVQIGTGWLILFALVTAFTFVMDYVAGIYGAKKFGASKWGVVGSLVGLVVGLLVGGLVGMILGTMVGAVLFELVGGKSAGDAAKAGVGALVGFLGGIAFKTILSLALIITFFALLIAN